MGAVPGPSKKPTTKHKTMCRHGSKCDTRINSFHLHSNPKRSENCNDPILQTGKLRANAFGPTAGVQPRSIWTPVIKHQDFALKGHAVCCVGGGVLECLGRKHIYLL